MITWMKKANNFQIAQVQSEGVALLLLDFFLIFQPGVAYKSITYKKSVYILSVVETSHQVEVV